jgi:hypothetical protein
VGRARPPRIRRDARHVIPSLSRDRDPSTYTAVRERQRSGRQTSYLAADFPKSAAFEDAPRGGIDLNDAGYARSIANALPSRIECLSIVRMFRAERGLMDRCWVALHVEDRIRVFISPFAQDEGPAWKAAHSGAFVSRAGFASDVENSGTVRRRDVGKPGKQIAVRGDSN